SRFWTDFHSIQTSFNRRFRDGWQFGINYSLTLRQAGTNTLAANEGLRVRSGPGATFTDDPTWAEAEDLLGAINDGMVRHIIKANAVWDLPDYQASSAGGRVLSALVNDWQLAAVLTAGSGGRYEVGYSYQTGGSNQNLTGSPNYAARPRIVGDPGSGRSSNQYAQVNADAFAGPLPGGLALESGRNYMVGCPDRTVDLALSRAIRLGGTRALELRADFFNVFNAVVFNGRQATLQLVSPTDQTVRNPQYNEDGSLNQNRLRPQDAGFGAATAAQPMRSVQLQVRFRF